VLTASNGATDDHFGSAISISSDANTVVVGASMMGNGGPGSAYVFTRSGSSWIQAAELTASDGAAGDLFGNSVSISGNNVVVGAYGEMSNQGAAYVYAKPAGGWTNMTQTTKLTASDAAAGADFGDDMAVSISGNTLVAGAPLANGNGAAYVFGPAILTVSTPAAAGAHYKAGGKVPIKVTFSAPVKVSGTPQLTLADGGTAKYSSGTGTTTLTFTYTVAAGQNTTDLDYASTAALLLNGGSIKGLTGNAVNIALPPTGTDGLATKEIVVDTTPPTVTAVSSTIAAGTYGVGTAIPITVTFSEAVKVTGKPKLALDAGSGAAAIYTGGSGTSTLTFTYKVAAKQNTADLDYSSTTALTLNLGSIKDLAGNTAILKLPPTGTDGLATAEIVVDTTPPTVTAVSSTIAAGTYGAGTAIPITVTFSEVVNVTGTPKLALDAGSGAAAIYTGGSGTSTLTFTYTVAAMQNTADLDYSSTTALTLNGGSIKDLFGNTAILNLPRTGTDGLAAEKIVIHT
jgi:hypothetical protein